MWDSQKHAATWLLQQYWSFGDHETVVIFLVLAAFGVAIWYQVRKGRKKSAVKVALWLALLIVLWWFGTGHGPTPPQH
jgi:thiol:disulfide interchange protein